MRALMSVMPFAAHVHPLAGFAQGWLARGHQLTVYSGAAFSHRFPGATFVPWQAARDFDERRLSDTFPTAGRGGPRGMMTNVRDVFIGTAPGQAEDLTAELDSGDYSVLIGDSMSLGARFAAERTGVPWATLSIVPFSMMQPGLPPPGLGLEPGLGIVGSARDAILRAVVGAASRSLDRALKNARREAGLPPSPRGSAESKLDKAWYSAELTVLTGCPELAFNRSGLPSGFHYVGRLPGPGRQYPRWGTPRSSRPLVLVTQGTFNTDPNQVLRPAMDALAGVNVDVVVTTGQAGRLDVGTAAPNTHVVDFVDFETLLPRCAAMVTNAGWGGTLHALSFGVPLVLAGADLDKPEIAARVSAAGAGINLGTGTPTPAAIRGAVGRVLHEPRWRECAAALKPKLTDGRTTAIELIEALVG